MQGALDTPTSRGALPNSCPTQIPPPKSVTPVVRTSEAFSEARRADLPSAWLWYSPTGDRGMTTQGRARAYELGTSSSLFFDKYTSFSTLYSGIVRLAL